MGYDLHETRRLIDEISTLLRDDGSDSLLGDRLSARYADECRNVNLRLSHCGKMIASGDARQALLLASQSPDLLDWITLLDFFEVDEWRQRCADDTNSWESPQTINQLDLQALNEIFSSGLTVDDPYLTKLWGQHRAGMMKRDFASALISLRRICQINPGDVKAAAQLSVLDKNVLEPRMIELGNLLQIGTPVQVVEAVEKLERSGFQTPLNGPVWERAQHTRCVLWLEMAQKQRGKNNWKETERRLGKIHELMQAHPFKLMQSEAIKLRELDGWVGLKLKNNETEEAFETQLSQVRYLVEQSEESLATKTPTLARLRRDHACLYKEWRLVEHYSMPVDAETTQRYRKLMAMMEAAIDQQASQSLWKKVATVSAALLLLGGLAWGFLAWLGKADESQQLDSLVRSRLVTAAKARLDNLRAKSNVPESGDLGKSIAKAETFITHEEGLLQTYKSSLQSLTNKFGFSPDMLNIKELEQKMSQVKVELAELAPEFNVIELAILTAFENRWEQFLQKTNSKLNDGFELGLKQMETQSQGLTYSQSVPQLRTNVQKTSQFGLELSVKKGEVAPRILIKPTFLQRLDSARQIVAEFEKEFKAYDAAIEALVMAKDGKAAKEAIDQFADSKMEASAEVKSATLIGPQSITTKMSLINLLGLTPRQVEYLMQPDLDLIFTPKGLLEAEKNSLGFLDNRFFDKGGPTARGRIKDLALFKKPYKNGSGDYSLLKELDYLNIRSAVDPLLCATFIIEFSEIMKLRPDDWGWSFSPKLQRHAAALKKELDLARWEFGLNREASKYSVHVVALEKIFADWGVISAQKEAQVNALLMKLSLKEEFSYVGYVNIDGTPTLATPLAPAELWGYSKDGALKLFFEKQTGKSYIPSKLELRPLTLLFGAKKSRSDLLEESGYNALGAGAKNDLPAFFSIKID